MGMVFDLPVQRAPTNRGFVALLQCKNTEGVLRLHRARRSKFTPRLPWRAKGLSNAVYLKSERRWEKPRKIHFLGPWNSGTFQGSLFFTSVFIGKFLEARAGIGRLSQQLRIFSRRFSEVTKHYLS